MSEVKGKQSLRFAKTPFILNSASVVGKKEGEGPLGEYFDVIGNDDKFGCESWEEAESTLQKEAATLALGKAGLTPEEIRYIFAGDLLGQTIATSFGLLDFEIPLFGVYGACSTAGESMSLGAMCVAAGFAENVLTITSSHFASAEKQFRFPLEYGNQRPMSATWTVTGSGAYVLSTQRTHVKISGITTGKIVDYGIHDSLNMGAAMAPAAADTIAAHFTDFGSKPEEYDRIITGDLGTVDTDAGGSGCGCSASVLSAYYLPKIISGEWKKVLFVPTGALLSTVSYNEGKNVPGIAHGVMLEYVP